MHSDWFLKKKNGLYKVERVNINIGPLSDHGYIINKGLDEGDMVAVAGLSFLYDGKVVKLLK